MLKQIREASMRIPDSWVKKLLALSLQFHFDCKFS
jgi:hypothetical protein